MGSKLNALLEVALVYILILAVSKLIVTFPFPSALGLRGDDVNHIFIYLVESAIILGLLILTKRDLSRYGISIRNAGNDLKAVTICAIPMLINLLAGNVVNIGSLYGTLFVTAVEILMLFVMAKLLTSLPYKDDKVALGTLIVIPAISLPLINGAGTFVVVFFYAFVFSGPVQELIYRGYIQSRLNEALGRPYRLFGVNLGAGIIIASLLFALAHVLGPFNPLIGNYQLDLLVGVWTFFSGLTFGFIREKTGSIVAPSILHSAFNFPGFIFSYLWI